ncbi:hypothetical protein FRC12_004141 [Ceratobasidium sp. 428]|nr:hypothetical protein FRC12_004141 [Ceratobasidium sp. 428]
MVASKIFTLLVGATTGNVISSVRFDPSSKDISLIGKSYSGPNPSWISTHPHNNSILLSANEGRPLGGLSTFVITDRKNGVIKRVSNSSSFGDTPAYMAALSSVRQVGVMDYFSGNGAFIPLGKDLLTLDAANAQKITFDANVSHPHQVVEHGDEVLVPDLGADKIWRLKQQPRQGRIPNWQVRGFIQQPAGSGPRHIVVHDGIVYTIHETASTLTSQRLPPLGSDTQPKIISSFSVLPPGVNQSAFGAAELVLDAKRKLIYTSNRDQSPSGPSDPRGDAITIFSFDRDGKLKPTSQIFTGLNRVRGMAQGGPDNMYIAAAGQTGGGLAIFEKDGNTLKKRARLAAGHIDQPAGFVWL